MFPKPLGLIAWLIAAAAYLLLHSLPQRLDGPDV